MLLLSIIISIMEIKVSCQRIYMMKTRMPVQLASLLLLPLCLAASPSADGSSTTQPSTDDNMTVHITIPKPPKAPEPVKLKVDNKNTLDSRAIKFSKRYPPGWVPPAERTKAKKEAISTDNIGGINAERISTYLRAPLISVNEAEKNLKDAGFKIISVSPLDKKKQLVVIVFTNDALEKFAVDNKAEFLASMRLLVDKKDNHITITNPLYLSRAFIQKDDFDTSVPKSIIKTLTQHFKGLVNSKDKLKYNLLPKYCFMHGMPKYQDMVEVAQGDDLVANVQGKKQVIFQQKLPNGAVLLGIKFRRRTEKFPYRIGTNNAALLPYPALIKNGKAYIMDPKYYISVMYPRLKMSEFMTIATVPDAIIKESQRVFRKRK
jgi:hypothetical protein